MGGGSDVFFGLLPLAGDVYIIKSSCNKKGHPISQMTLKLVGTTRFELAASCTPCKRATGLRYVPKTGTRVEDGMQK